MSSYLDAVILLEDLEEFSKNHRLQEAKKLIVNARIALKEDFESSQSPSHLSQKSSQIYLDK